MSDLRADAGLFGSGLSFWLSGLANPLVGNLFPRCLPGGLSGCLAPSDLGCLRGAGSTVQLISQGVEHVDVTVSDIQSRVILVVGPADDVRFLAVSSAQATGRIAQVTGHSGRIFTSCGQVAAAVADRLDTGPGFQGTDCIAQTTNLVAASLSLFVGFTGQCGRSASSLLGWSLGGCGSGLLGWRLLCGLLGRLGQTGPRLVATAQSRDVVGQLAEFFLVTVAGEVRVLSPQPLHPVGDRLPLLWGQVGGLWPPLRRQRGCTRLAFKLPFQFLDPGVLAVDLGFLLTHQPFLARVDALLATVGSLLGPDGLSLPGSEDLFSIGQALCGVLLLGDVLIDNAPGCPLAWIQAGVFRCLGVAFPGDTASTRGDSSTGLLDGLGWWQCLVRGRWDAIGRDDVSRVWWR